MAEKKRRRWNIPHDAVEEILVKLPVKSLLRFKAVSKEWRGIIESKCFVEEHIRYQKSTGQARIVALKSRGRKRIALENLLLSTNGIVHGSPYRPFRSFRFILGSKISEPCDGLLCLYNRARIFNLVNPATTSLRRLPDPISNISEAGGHTSCSLLGIGRDNSVSRRYKLLWFFDFDNKLVNKSTRCKVFALDSNTWRYVDPPHCRVYYDQPLIHLDGVLYCFSFCVEERSFFTNEQGQKILAFDLHKETFQSFSITPDIGFTYCRQISMCVLNHRLCIFQRRIDKNDLFFKIWGLDINKRSWDVMYSIEFSCFPPEFQIYRAIIPVATINNYVILSDLPRTIWVLYGSKIHSLHRTFIASSYFTSSFETLVSAYQYVLP